MNARDEMKLLREVLEHMIRLHMVAHRDQRYDVRQCEKMLARLAAMDADEEVGA